MQLTSDVFGAVVEHRGESYKVPEERRCLAGSRSGRLQDPVVASLLRSWSGTCTASGALFFLERLFGGLLKCYCLNDWVMMNDVALRRDNLRTELE